MNMKRIVIIAAVVIVIGFIGFRVVEAVQKSAADKAVQANTQNYTPVEVLTVAKGSIASAITLSGKVQADREAPALVKAPARVTAVYAKVGDRVNKDQVLFSMEKTTIQSAYDQAAAAYKIAEANYQTNMRNYEKSKENLERMQELYKAGAVSKVDLDQAQLAASDSLKAMYEGQLAQVKASYDAAAQSLADMDVKSPIDGILTVFDVSVGNIPSVTAPSAIVVDLQDLYVTVSVSEKEINNLKTGQEVQVGIPSASQKVKGKIEELSQASNSQGKYMLKTYFANKDGTIKPGMFANVTLNILTKDKVMVLPSDAVVFHNGKNVVYLVKDRKAVQQEVTIGLENGTETEITGGLAVGDVAVIKGQDFLSHGAAIKVIARDGKAVGGGGAQ